MQRTIKIFSLLEFWYDQVLHTNGSLWQTKVNLHRLAERTNLDAITHPLGGALRPNTLRGMWDIQMTAGEVPSLDDLAKSAMQFHLSHRHHLISLFSPRSEPVLAVSRRSTFTLPGFLHLTTTMWSSDAFGNAPHKVP